MSADTDSHLSSTAEERASFTERLASAPDGCYAVIFHNRRSTIDSKEYDEAGRRMTELAKAMPGFIAVDSVRDSHRSGITVSYWRSLEEIAAWRRHGEHLEAQRLGRERWYERFELAIAKVESIRVFAADSEIAEEG
jgi:heme-degrading monooxygenase HmoA